MKGEGVQPEVGLIVMRQKGYSSERRIERSVRD